MDLYPQTPENRLGKQGKTVSKPDPALGNWGELHDLSRSLPDYFLLLQDQSYSRKGNLALWAFSYFGSSEFNTAIVYSVKHLSIKDGAMKEAVLWNTEMPACSSSEGLLLRTQQRHQSSEAVPREVGQDPRLLIPGWRGPCCNYGVTVPERSFPPLPPTNTARFVPLLLAIETYISALTLRLTLSSLTHRLFRSGGTITLTLPAPLQRLQNLTQVCLHKVVNSCLIKCKALT